MKKNSTEETHCTETSGRLAMEIGEYKTNIENTESLIETKEEILA